MPIFSAYDFNMKCFKIRNIHNLLFINRILQDKIVQQYKTMCLTVFILSPTQSNTDIRFVVGFNRDQQIKRPTLPFGQFQDDPHIWGGRDEKSKGTWLGINSHTGIFAMLTNFDYIPLKFGKSRGKMMSSILTSKLVQKIDSQSVDQAIIARLKQILSERTQYSPFSLVVYNIRSHTLFHICTEKDMKQPQKLEIRKKYGLCNGFIDDIWPKTQRALNFFDQSLQVLDKKGVSNCIDSISELFKDKKKFKQDLEAESSIFIEPYFSKMQNADRITKSTFVGVVVAKQDKFEFNCREVTYQPEKLQQSIIETKVIISK